MANNEDVRRRILVVAVSVLLFVVLSAVITAFPFQLTRVAGRAMEPALKDQQRLIVDKLTYRVQQPRSGDVVMLYHPLDPNRLLVQRVIAREGDTLKIVAGNVYLNDKPLNEDYVPSEFKSHDDWGRRKLFRRVTTSCLETTE